MVHTTFIHDGRKIATVSALSCLSAWRYFFRVFPEYWESRRELQTITE